MIKTFVSSNPTGLPLPKQNLTAHYDDRDGRIFFASIDNESADFLCASYDGVPVLTYEGHTYFPSDWLCKEYPEFKDTFDSMAQKVLGELKSDEGHGDK